MLTMAYAYLGNHRDYYNNFAFLRRAVPSTLEDYLFLAQVTWSIDPAKALELAQRAMDIRDCQITRIVHAHAMGHFAVWSGNPELALSARQQSEMVARQMKPNAYALTIQLAALDAVWELKADPEMTLKSLCASGTPIVQRTRQGGQGISDGACA